MQIIEASCLGVRAARFRFAKPGSPYSVTLFPMIHVGEAAFFESVYEDAFGHDVALVEGVRSPVVRNLTRSYRWLDRARLGLIVQPKYPPPETVPARIVRADLSDKEFHAEWRKVRLHLRLLIFLFAPVAGLKLRWFGSREGIAKRLAIDDHRSAEEILSWNPAFVALKHSILGARDARIVALLSDELDRPSQQPCRLAMVYGAMHMRAVLVELRRRGFTIVENRWQTVFTL